MASAVSAVGPIVTLCARVSGGATRLPGTGMPAELVWPRMDTSAAPAESVAATARATLMVQRC